MAGVCVCDCRPMFKPKVGNERTLAGCLTAREAQSSEINKEQN